MPKGIPDQSPESTPKRRTRSSKPDQAPTPTVTLEGAGEVPEYMSGDSGVVAPEPKVTANKAPDIAPNQPVDQVLFLYDISTGERGQYTEAAVVVPIEVENAPTEKGALKQFEYKNVFPGLQRLSRVDAEAILKQKGKANQDHVNRGVFQIWSDTCDLSEMSIPKAQEAVRKTTAPNLLADWAKGYRTYPKPVQEALERQSKVLAESKVKRSLSGDANNQLTKAPTELFGVAI